ncbi:MAG: M18 family aminopeptidase, partial [Spirochaetales bacterium]|nr:M18 family aminopeptidase [Spirochaetales bacterium]
SLVAFRVGKKAPSEAGFALSGAHADAPGLRARMEKPVAARGAERVAVEAYGGPIHSTWLDRPLSLAGRVVIRSGGTGFESRLVNFGRAVAVIPNLAIHFNRDMNKGVEYPINATLLPLVASARPQASGVAVPGASWLTRAVAAELGVEPDAIMAAELGFVDAFPAMTFGADAELLSAPRIDNLEGCHAVLSAFASASASDHTQVAVLFDNEEIGSETPRGANSSFLRDTLERIVSLTDGTAQQAMPRALARSFSVSVDGAQGWHPSYADKFDEDYAPTLNGGPAIKSSANVRYATDSIGEAAFRGYCEMAHVPWQRFRMRADIMPGTTIGPISAALLGVRTVDVGVPMLAMHSARETAGSYDHDSMIAALKVFYAADPGSVG